MHLSDMVRMVNSSDNNVSQTLKSPESGGEKSHIFNHSKTENLSYSRTESKTKLRLKPHIESFKKQGTEDLENREKPGEALLRNL